MQVVLILMGAIVFAYLLTLGAVALYERHTNTRKKRKSPK